MIQINLLKIFTAVAAIILLTAAEASAEHVDSGLDVDWTRNLSKFHSSLKQTAKKSVEEYADSAQADYTGLIVDCRGLKLQPVMSPVIKNSNGTKIYGHKNLDVDKIVVMGVVDYAKDTAHVDRAGDNPLFVKAIALEDFNSNPVVSIPDSNRILIENHATKFLRDLKVVFLCD